MKTRSIVVVLCGTAMILALLGQILAITNDRTQPPVEAPIPKRSYTLDVSRPECFLEAHLPGVFEETPPDSLPVAAMDGDATVYIRNGSTREGGKSVEMDIILMTSSISSPRRESAEYDIHLIGSPATLEEAYTLARRICAVAGIKNDRIVKWYEQKEYEAPIGYAGLQTGKSSDGRFHAVEIRHSLTLDDVKPWAVDYQIHFTTPEQDKLFEICPQQLNEGP